MSFPCSCAARLLRQRRARADRDVLPPVRRTDVVHHRHRGRARSCAFDGGAASVNMSRRAASTLSYTAPGVLLDARAAARTSRTPLYRRASARTACARRRLRMAPGNSSDDTSGHASHERHHAAGLGPRASAAESAVTLAAGWSERQRAGGARARNVPAQAAATRARRLAATRRRRWSRGRRRRRRPRLPTTTRRLLHRAPRRRRGFVRRTRGRARGGRQRVRARSASALLTERRRRTVRAVLDNVRRRAIVRRLRRRHARPVPRRSHRILLRVRAQLDALRRWSERKVRGLPVRVHRRGDLERRDRVAHQPLPADRRRPDGRTDRATDAEAERHAIPDRDARPALPTMMPTTSPSLSLVPSARPSPAPTMMPSAFPTLSPVPFPTPAPSDAPTLSPTFVPTVAPTPTPTPVPAAVPTPTPSSSPTQFPSFPADTCADGRAVDAAPRPRRRRRRLERQPRTPTSAPRRADADADRATDARAQRLPTTIPTPRPSTPAPSITAAPTTLTLHPTADTGPLDLVSEDLLIAVQLFIGFEAGVLRPRRRRIARLPRWRRRRPRDARRWYSGHRDRARGRRGRVEQRGRRASLR